MATSKRERTYRWRAQDDGGANIQGHHTFDEIAVCTKAGGCWLHVEQMDARKDGTGGYFMTLGNRAFWFIVAADGSVKVTGCEDRDGPDASRPSNQDTWPEMRRHEPEKAAKKR